jgi:hypothetical protein
VTNTLEESALGAADRCGRQVIGVVELKHADRVVIWWLCTCAELTADGVATGHHTVVWLLERLSNEQDTLPAWTEEPA